MFTAASRLRGAFFLAALAACIALVLTGVSCANRPAPSAVSTAEQHSDSDGIPDHIEKSLGLDHESIDTDDDGIPDKQELIEHHSRLTSAGVESEAGSRGPFELQLAVADDINYTLIPAANDANDPWAPYVGDPGQPHVALGETEVTLVHNSIKGRLPWSEGVSTDQYWAAFRESLQNTSAAGLSLPLGDPRPDALASWPETPTLWGGSVVTSAAAALDAAKASSSTSGGINGLRYPAVIHHGLCDDDGDGISNWAETNGYNVISANNTYSRAVPWAGDVVGRATYSLSDGRNFTEWGQLVAGKVRSVDPDPKPSSYPQNLVATRFERRTEDKRRDAPYYKTSPRDVNTDGDPDGDGVEVDLLYGTVRSTMPAANRPMVANFPQIKMEFGDPDIEYSGLSAPNDWIDDAEEFISSAAPLAEGVAKTAVLFAGAEPPPVADNGPLGGVGSPFALPRAFATSETAESPTAMIGHHLKKTDAIHKVEAITATVEALPSFLRLVGKYFGYTKGEPIDWATIKAKDPNAAATATIPVLITNTGLCSAYDVSPSCTVFLGDQLVGGGPQALQTVPIEQVAPGETKAAGTVKVTLTLAQLRMLETGGATFLAIPSNSNGALLKRSNPDVPIPSDSPYAWTVVKHDIQADCTRIVFDTDLGQGHYASYLVGAGDEADGQHITIRDAINATVKTYPTDSRARYLIPSMGSAEPTSVSSFDDWLVIFDDEADSTKTKRYYVEKDVDGGPRGHVYLDAYAGSSSLDVPLVPGSTVHLVSKARYAKPLQMADAYMEFGTPTPNTEGAVEQKTVFATTANPSECYSGSVKVYFVPDKTNPDKAIEMKRVAGDTFTIFEYETQATWTGQERVYAEFLNWDGAKVRSEMLPVTAPKAPNAIALMDGQYSLARIESTPTVASWSDFTRLSDTLTFRDITMNDTGNIAAVSTRGHLRIGHLRWKRAADATLSWYVKWNDPGLPNEELDAGDTPKVDLDNSGRGVMVYKVNGWRRVSEFKLDASAPTGFVVTNRKDITTDGFDFDVCVGPPGTPVASLGAWDQFLSVPEIRQDLPFAQSQDYSVCEGRHPSVAYIRDQKYLIATTDRQTGDVKVYAATLKGNPGAQWLSADYLSPSTVISGNRGRVSAAASPNGTLLVLASGWGSNAKHLSQGQLKPDDKGRLVVTWPWGEAPMKMEGWPGWEWVAIDIVDRIR